jgi:chemotaxis protein MotB
MSADDLQRPIIVKRIKKVAGGHHGGAWKIAYADFVTAMMAFFLLMWLLGSVDGGTLQGISEYFKTPMKVALQGGSKSGDSKVVIQGGGLDLTSKDGQTSRSESPPGENEAQNEEKKFESLTESQKKAAVKLQQAQEVAKMKAMREKLINQIDNSPRLKKYQSQLKIDVTDEGLRVLITDEANRPMFANASSEMQAFAQDIIKAMAPTFNDLPNTISISGHTDSMPYANNNGAYTNWELSADRANAARRVLLAGGLDPKHMLRVTGLADAILLDPQNPMNPINRRISIILLNKAAEQAVRDEGKLKTTVIDPALKEIDQPNKLPSFTPEKKEPPVIEQPKVEPQVKAQEQAVVVPKPSTSQVPSQVDKPIPSATTPSRTESKPPAFQPIQKNQIIQLEKPVPSKN